MLIIPPSAPPLYGHGVSAAKNPALPFEPLRFAHNDRAAEIRAERSRRPDRQRQPTPCSFRLRTTRSPQASQKKRWKTSSYDLQRFLPVLNDGVQ